MAGGDGGPEEAAGAQVDGGADAGDEEVGGELEGEVAGLEDHY